MSGVELDSKPPNNSAVRFYSQELDGTPPNIEALRRGLWPLNRTSQQSTAQNKVVWRGYSADWRGKWHSLPQ